MAGKTYEIEFHGWVNVIASSVEEAHELARNILKGVSDHVHIEDVTDLSNEG